jgi:dihydroxy-acid dehydratase
MLTGKYQGKNVATSDVWRLADEVTKGTFTIEQLREVEACMCRSDGHCAVMGTASTMACMVESLGLTLPGNAAIPAADSRRKLLAQFSGRRIVDMVREEMSISKILTREAFENSIKVNAAIGGSTNFVLHLLAIAGRMEIPLTLDDFDALGSGMPLLANLQPSGEFFMEDFYYAGGLPAVINQLKGHLHRDIITVSGKSVADNNNNAKIYSSSVIAKIDEPFQEEAGIVVVRGNLAARGTVIKPSAASPALMKHQGKAVVFEDIEDYHARINSDDLEVDETCVLVLKNVGPKGYPGMPEVGNMGLPKKLLDKGVTDMVRISDGRMSGTAFGTVFLHVAPESADGGTLAFVRNGDLIEVDVANKYIHLHVSDEELEERRKNWLPPDLGYHRGYIGNYIQHVQQADLGADLDYLRGKSGSTVTRDSH